MSEPDETWSLHSISWCQSGNSSAATPPDFRTNLSPHRHGAHVIGVADPALAHGVFEFIFEAVGGTDAALGGKGAAEHGAAIRKLAVRKAAFDQFVDGQDRIQRSFLVQLAP